MLRPGEETSIKLFGEWDSPDAERVSNALLSALALEHKIPHWIRSMQGMSGRKYRSLINNLVENTPDARYLEIGSWLGSTACSAMYGNTCKALCIDNWTQFLWGGDKNHYKSSFERSAREAAGTTVDFNFFDEDFRKIDYTSIGKFNIFMFDGPHERIDQYEGVKYAQPALDDTYVLVVDDFNSKNIQEPTYEALNDLKQTIVASIVINTTQDGIDPQLNFQNSDWHNGYFIGVIKKNLD